MPPPNTEQERARAAQADTTAGGEAQEGRSRGIIGPRIRRNALSRLGVRLKRARRNSGLNQEAVARKAGVSTQTVRNWEAGRHEPPAGVIRELATLYMVSEDTLISDLAPPVVATRPAAPAFRYDRVEVDPKKLARARREAGLIQAKVAEMTGLSLSTIRRYESGSARPATKTLQALASIYDRPAGWFTHRGHFTEEESALFARSVITNPGSGSHDALVQKVYDRIKPDLSDAAKLRIANFILFTHDLDL